MLLSVGVPRAFRVITRYTGCMLRFVRAVMPSIRRWQCAILYSVLLSERVFSAGVPAACLAVSWLSQGGVAGKVCLSFRYGGVRRPDCILYESVGPL